MEDLIYVAAIIVFFVIASLFVVACDKIIGPDEAALAEGGTDELEIERMDEAA